MNSKDKRCFNFNWTRFYEVIAEKLLTFRNRRDELIAEIHTIASKVDGVPKLQDQFSDASSGPLKDICPFTAMGIFNRNITDANRKAIASELASLLGVSEPVPDSFDGIPLLDNRKPLFFGPENKRQPNDIEILWEVFAQAIAFAESDNAEARLAFASAYDNATQVYNVKKNLTMGLYWIRPWNFPTLDSQSLDYISKELNIQVGMNGHKRFCNATDYLAVLDTLKACFQENVYPVHSFPQLSFVAWLPKDSGTSVYPSTTASNAHNDEAGVTSEAEVTAVPIAAASLGNSVVHPSPSLVQLAASKPIAPCINRIYYGPPGTGKTYALIRLLKRDYEQQMESVSTEEWRNQIIVEKVAVLKWWEGAAAALYDLGGKARVADIAEHRFIQAITAANGSNRNVRQTLWGSLQNHTVDESATVKVKKRLSPAVFDKAVDSVWQFAGDWQDDCADLIALVDQLKRGQQDAGAIQRYSFVTFHQSYGYEEFVEGLRPVLAGETEAGEVAYEIRPGAFKELCRKARQTPDQRFAMVIDEINRGNISKIFGELITLIEADKRDPLNGSTPPVEVVLAYSGEKFSVPANVDIIGTMNTADRSVALLDTALRRRFEFVALLPDTRAEKDPGDPDSAPLAGVVVTTDAGTIDVRQLLERINERIEALYDRDHCIGHAYLTNLAQVDDGPQRFEVLMTAFRRRIVPLLEEYFFDDWRKIRLVLGDNQKKDTTLQFVGESDAHEQDLTTLFGNDHGLDSYAAKRRYDLQESAFSNPAAYIGIYQASA